MGLQQKVIRIDNMITRTKSIDISSKYFPQLILQGNIRISIWEICNLLLMNQTQFLTVYTLVVDRKTSKMFLTHSATLSWIEVLPLQSFDLFIVACV